MPQPQLQVRENGPGAALLDVPESIPGELGPRVDHHEIRRIEQPADVVDANRDEPFRMFEFLQRGAAATRHDRLPAMSPAIIGERQRKVVKLRSRSSPRQHQCVVSVRWRADLTAYFPDPAANSLKVCRAASGRPVRASTTAR